MNRARATCATCAHTRARHLRDGRGRCRSCECPEYVDARDLPDSTIAPRSRTAPTAPAPPDLPDLPPLDVPPMPPTVEESTTAEEPAQADAAGADTESPATSATNDAPALIGADDPPATGTGVPDPDSATASASAPVAADWTMPDVRDLARAVEEQLAMLDRGLQWVGSRTTPLPGIPEGSRAAAAPPLGRIIGRHLAATASPDAIAVAVALGVPLAANVLVLGAWYATGKKRDATTPPDGEKTPATPPARVGIGM